MKELIDLHNKLLAVLSKYSTESSMIRQVLSPTMADVELDKVNTKLYQLRTGSHRDVIELVTKYLETRDLVVVTKPKESVFR